MQKRYSVILSLFLISILSIAGCQESIGKPITSEETKASTKETKASTKQCLEYSFTDLGNCPSRRCVVSNGQHCVKKPSSSEKIVGLYGVDDSFIYNGLQIRLLNVFPNNTISLFVSRNNTMRESRPIGIAVDESANIYGAKIRNYAPFYNAKSPDRSLVNITII